MGDTMQPGVRAAFKVGIFGIILVGLCAMSLGLLCGLFSLDPIVYFASMAGVLVPMIMVLAGALALWASRSPGLFAERRRPRRRQSVLPPLIAGLVTEAGAAILFLLALAVPLEGLFLPLDRLSTYFGNLDAYGYLEIAVLIVAYLALAVIGGVLYDIVVPEDIARYKG